MAETIVITGASRGLGRHLAESLSGDGYRVIGLARSVAAIPKVEMRACDVSNWEAVKSTCKDLRRDKTVRALINVAGVAAMNLSISTPAETVARIINTNLNGTIYCCQAISPALIRNGGGRIINFSTIAVPLALKGEAVYAASKAGVETFSRAFAREMADHQCTVNCIAPGPIDTDLIANVPADKIDAVVARQIIQRKSNAGDVDQIVRFLLSGASDVITGQTFHLGGV